ncbi:hypothetical protein INT47_009234 [Mucor saturninus]|uniref:Transposase domain-containing protein n=1 Tax=Mucor saturninus TaxID=64648 RepID=A0A8H7QI68_9FUNG|nr:hypothetical protein INT47_009234 [Mucor saturninus]
MAPIRKSTRTKECRCSICKNKEGGFDFLTAQTFKRHMLKEDAKNSFFGGRSMEIVDDEEQYFEAVDNVEAMDFESGDLENDIEGHEGVQEPIRNLPLSESDAIFGAEDECSSFGDSDSDSDNESEDEMLDNEEFNSELSFIHGFVVKALALFISFYVVNEGAIILIAIVNKILDFFGDSFRVPSSVSGLKSMAGMDTLTKGIKKYVACGECHSIYENDGAPLFCTFDKFGNSALCGHSLFKSSSSTIPKKSYVYQSIKHSLQTLFSRPDFETQINSWNRGPKVEKTMFDVYDGAMWNSVKDINGNLFVDDSRSLMLTLNIDWFQPFDGVSYSCGAIYLAVNNLPRDVRFKKENVILVGLMPGPKEAKTSEINNYLRPLVDELEELYQGIILKTHQCPSGVRIRAALFVVACDIPAARKVCGFTSHTSTNACHKCNRQFTRLAGTSSVDYSGFDFSKWLLRTRDDNRKDAEVWRNAATQTERQRLEVASGVRWSELHRLQYFDVVRCTIIDPMHNLS